jgi:hypothetical protein
MDGEVSPQCEEPVMDRASIAVETDGAAIDGCPSRALGPQPPDQLDEQRTPAHLGLLCRVDHYLLPHRQDREVVVL